MKGLTRHASRRLDALALEHEERADTYDLAGRSEEAEEEREIAADLRARLAEAAEARRAEEERQRQERRRQREAREARERAEKEAQAKARAFLEKLFESPFQHIEAREVRLLAEEEGIAEHRLVTAASEMGLRTLAWTKPGTATIRDRSKPVLWGRSQLSGPIDAGPPTLPAA